ncbi:helix-turn-helix domain-containing protein [Pseudoalteromonas denitrificans]|uniref:Regulatory protein, luxR family n=1 Tax=Pseudoalteromonas denitrificans DSM 6059 TaxID=1123010 RepID=A0A1I1PNT0_9GAMM|nr:helix-turn-helix transcriptional regulator [Pseudoalteromonas denitrificans]SFD11554.1 regulatory protein, luxR family [Pseudoalteromonas denitrificans DSM 6059]
MNKQISLNTLLLSSMEQAGMIVCIKDNNKKVLKQNKKCITLCGLLEGEVCNDGCMQIYNSDTNQQWNNWGNRTYPNCYLHNDYYDVTLLCSEQNITTILQPLKQKLLDAIAYYNSMGLSKREMQVISKVITDLTNDEICEQLFISKATLRSHLNNIYKKVELAGGSLSYIPHKRSNR